MTIPPRLIFDLCGCVHAKRAERAFGNALLKDLTTPESVAVVLAEIGGRGRKGTVVCRALVDAHLGETIPLTELERLVVAVLESAGLALPQKQRSVGGTTALVGRIDFLYRESRFIIEADSKRYHNWQEVEADHRRDGRLLAAGFHVPLRVTWWQLVHEAEDFVAAVKAGIGLAP